MHQSPDVGESMAPVLDREHLSRQSMGDMTLARDLLALFDRRCAELLPRILATAAASERGDLAHSLKGSALAVGARRVAAAAARYEEALRTPGDTASAYTALAAAVDEARAAITTEPGARS